MPSTPYTKLPQLPSRRTNGWRFKVFKVFRDRGDGCSHIREYGVLRILVRTVLPRSVLLASVVDSRKHFREKVFQLQCPRQGWICRSCGQDGRRSTLIGLNANATAGTKADRTPSNHGRRSWRRHTKHTIPRMEGLAPPGWREGGKSGRRPVAGVGRALHGSRRRQCQPVAVDGRMRRGRRSPEAKMHARAAGRWEDGQPPPQALDV